MTDETHSTRTLQHRQHYWRLRRLQDMANLINEDAAGGLVSFWNQFLHKSGFNMKHSALFALTTTTALFALSPASAADNGPNSGSAMQTTTVSRMIPTLSAKGAQEMVDAVIESITRVASTGKIGDGKIFVTNLEQVIRIRTGEEGNEAV